MQSGGHFEEAFLKSHFKAVEIPFLKSHFNNILRYYSMRPDMGVKQSKSQIAKMRAKAGKNKAKTGGTSSQGSDTESNWGGPSGAKKNAYGMKGGDVGMK
jgi:hypothetical protein